MENEIKTNASKRQALSTTGMREICEKCGLPPRADEHDACLGELDPSIVMNACCGHGQRKPYVQFWTRECVRGDAALVLIRGLKHPEPGVPAKEEPE